ncbi:endonuclease V isoform X2 [Nomascus leucogenys]|nr:endonuclease V isoform X2 [Nomascus leucogenys]
MCRPTCSCQCWQATVDGRGGWEVQEMTGQLGCSIPACQRVADPGTDRVRRRLPPRPRTQEIGHRGPWPRSAWGLDLVSLALCPSTDLCSLREIFGETLACPESLRQAPAPPPQPHPPFSLAGFGVACHLGVLTDLPCVGVAKKLLQVDGLENNALHKEKIRLLQTRGDSFPLLGDSGTVLGMALRSHDRSTRPLYVSVGHKMSLEAAVRLTCCCCRFRIPEPVRQADICSREHIRKSLGLPGPPTPRSPKAQRPAACPRGDSGESPD